MLLVVAVAVIYCGQMIKIALNLKNPVSVHPTGTLKEDHVVIVDYEKSADSLSDKAVRKEITAYFDNFYAQNKNFSVRSFESEELTNTIGTWVNGYFQDEQLVWVQLATFGDMQERFSDYYVINSELTYVITNLYQHSTEKSTEMFLIDGKAWVSDGNDGFVLYPESDAEIEIYEIIRKELINNSNYSNHPIYFRNDDSMSNYENYQYPNFDATTN